MQLSPTLGCITSDLELVRVHHPDSLHTRDIPSPLAQSRFQSIAAAYDLLRYPHLSKLPAHRADDDVYMAELNRRKAYRGMGVRDWERQQQAMCADLDAGKWWNHDRAIVYAFGIIVRADFSLFLNQLHTCECLFENIRTYILFLRHSAPYYRTLQPRRRQRWSTANIAGLEHI